MSKQNLSGQNPSGRNLGSILTLVAVALASAMAAVAQSTTHFEIPSANATHSWQVAQAAWASEKKLVVVTVDQPDRRRSCRVKSFTADKLVCSRAIGGARTYLPQQAIALILPGDERSRIAVVLGLNGGLGAAIWGTVVLAAACPACAVGTGIAAFICFGFAGAVLMTDDQPDRLIYLAPGRQLSRKFSYVVM
jgi:hypothetical protein